MSNPNIPNITPALSLSRADVLNLLFSSIAMEELGLAHIINAEGEKIQFALGTLPGSTPATLAEVLQINGNVQAILDTLFRQEIMLDSKMRTAAGIPTILGPTGPTGPTGFAGSVFSVNGQTGEVILDADNRVFPLHEEPSDNRLARYNQPGVYSSDSPTGPPPPDGPQVEHPSVWTVYVSRVDNYVQQLYISNPALYYRSSQDGGSTYPGDGFRSANKG